MNLKHLILSGFRSFRDRHDVVFDSGAVFVLGTNQDDNTFDSNGAGKTTLCAAIPWALYGVLSTDAKKDQIINRDTDSVFVELQFDDGLIVRRSKERSKPEVLSYWQEKWHEGDLAMTQEKLNRILGISADLFFNSVWIDGQSKSVQFLWATPGKRMEILEELLAEGVYTAARSKAEAVRKEWEQKRSYAKGKVETLVAAEERERQNLNRAQQELGLAITARKERRAKEHARQVELRIEIGKIQAEIDALRDEATPDALNAKAQQLQWMIQKAEEEIEKLPAPVNLPSSESCPTCLQRIDPDHVRAVHMKAEGQRNLRTGLVESRNKAAAELADVRLQQRSYQSNAAARARLEALLRDRSREFSSFKESTSNDPFIDSLQETIERAKDAIAGIQGNIRQHEQIMHEANRKIPLYKFWEVGFGARGIRSLLLDDVRALLAHHVDLYASALAGDQIRVEFPQSDNGFKIVLHTPGGAADLSTFSRGEAWRANLGVLLALRKTVQYLNATPLSMLILDDPCGDLDDSGVRAVVGTVRTLASEFGTVLVTLPRLVDNVPEDAIIQVEKRDGRSTLVVVEEM